jgi:hypothetical protein
LDHEDGNVQADLDFSTVDFVVSLAVVNKQLTCHVGYYETDEFGEKQEDHEYYATY